MKKNKRLKRFISFMMTFVMIITIGPCEFVKPVKVSAATLAFVTQPTGGTTKEQEFEINWSLSVDQAVSLYAKTEDALVMQKIDVELTSPYKIQYNPYWTGKTVEYRLKTQNKGANVSSNPFTIKWDVPGFPTQPKSGTTEFMKPYTINFDTGLTESELASKDIYVYKKQDDKWANIDRVEAPYISYTFLNNVPSKGGTTETYKLALYDGKNYYNSVNFNITYGQPGFTLQPTNQEAQPNTKVSVPFSTDYTGTEASLMYDLEVLIGDKWYFDKEITSPAEITVGEYVSTYRIRVDGCGTSVYSDEFTVSPIGGREKVSNVKATSNLDRIFGFGKEIKNPTFTLTEGEPAYFSEGYWIKKDSDGIWRVMPKGTFGTGTWRYIAELRIDGVDALTHIFDQPTSLSVDENSWSGGNYPINNRDSSYTEFSSPDMVITETGKLVFEDRDDFDIPAGAIMRNMDEIDLYSAVSNGKEPYTFSKVSGPDWVKVSANGMIEGKRPSTNQDATTAKIQVVDADGAKGEIEINVGEIKTYEKITAIDVSDIEVPIIGNTPDFNGVLPKGAKYHFATPNEMHDLKLYDTSYDYSYNGIVWGYKDDDEFHSIMNTEQFEDGKEYYCQAVLIANEECEFDNSCEFSINGDSSYVGVDFKNPNEAMLVSIPMTPIKGYSLTVKNGTGSKYYKNGSEVIITADDAPEGKVFDKWIVESGDISIEDETNPTINILMPKNDITLKATYKDGSTSPTPTPPTPSPTSTPTPGIPTPSPTPETLTPSPTPGTGGTINPTPTPGTNVSAKIGETYCVKSYNYKVTSVDENGNGTVTVVSTTSKKVTTILIPSTVTINGKSYKVTSIADNAFKNCKKLKKITIGTNIVKIGKNAFYGCKSLKSIVVKSKKVQNVGKNAFKKINKKCVIKVPKTKLKVYKKVFGKKGQPKTVKIKK